jgi:hypothetical protein
MKKNKKTAAEGGIQAQLPDSKGINPARDARRRKGGAGLPSLPKGGGTAKFRKASRVPE